MKHDLSTTPVVILFLLLALLGCPSADDDSAADDDDTGSSDGCGFPAGGADGAATVEPGAPVTLEIDEGQALNLDEIIGAGALTAGGSTALRYGPCADAGVALWLGGGSTVSWQDPRTEEEAESVGSTNSRLRAALVHDDACSPTIVYAASPGVGQYVRQGDGKWQQESVVEDLAGVLGETPGSVTLLDAEDGGDGLFHVFFEASLTKGPAWVHGSRAYTAGATFSFEALPALQVSERFDLAVGPGGQIVAVFRNTQYPCDPCDVDLYLGTLDPGSGAWVHTVVQQGTWGAPNDLFVESASVAFGPGATPYLAAHFVERVITGSYQSTELRVYGQVDGAWCHETIATASDGYAGADGATFTGADPQLAVDDAGRLHVAFTDQAIWHDGQGWQNETRGQLRYAVRAGQTWTVTTVLSQSGQSDGASPLYGSGPPLLAVAPEGNRVVVAGLLYGWQTDSIYNEAEAPVTAEPTAVTLHVQLP